VIKITPAQVKNTREKMCGHTRSHKTQGSICVCLVVRNSLLSKEILKKDNNNNNGVSLDVTHSYIARLTRLTTVVLGEIWG